MELWISSMDPKSMNFIADFYENFNTFVKNIVTKPHYILWICMDCIESEGKIKNENCISKGKYCAPDPG